MKITIKGSPKEVSELLETMRSGAKKADLPSLLTDLVKDEKVNKLAKNLQPALEKMNELAKQRKENAPQEEAAEQDIPFIHFKPRFEEWIRIVREANEGE